MAAVGHRFFDRWYLVGGLSVPAAGSGGDVESGREDPGGGGGEKESGKACGGIGKRDR